MQGDFAKLQGQRRLIPAEGPRISMGWIGVSLTQEQGDPHSIAGKVDLETPRRCSSATFHAGQFNVRFRAPFGHRRMARRCRRLTHSGHSTKGDPRFPWHATVGVEHPFPIAG